MSNQRMQKINLTTFLKQTGQTGKSKQAQTRKQEKRQAKQYELKYSYINDIEINLDVLGRNNQRQNKNLHQYLYRSLESKVGLTQRETIHQDKLEMAAASKSQIKRHRNLQSIDEIGTKNKLYQIPISTNRLKQKYDRNGISFMKLTHVRQQQSSTFAQNFNTYFQFKQYMSKLSSQFNNKRSIYQNTGVFLRSMRKCSIIPSIKPRHKKSQSSQTSIQQSDEYIQTKKTKIKLQKSLVIESKKQELVSHIIAKYKDKKAKDDRQESQENIEAEVLKIEGIKKQKPAQYSKILHERNISFSFNSSEEGVYEQKIRTYRELLFIVNLAHRIYDPLVISDATVIKLQKTTIKKPTYYIGPGNNSMLVRSLMKRRTWWEEVKEFNNADFVWTQIKIASIFQNQSKFKKTQENNIEEETGEKDKESPERKMKRHKKQLRNQSSADKELRYEKVNDQGRSNSNVNPKGLMFRAPFAVSSFQKILCEQDSKYYKKMMHKISKGDIDNFQARLKYFPKNYLTNRDMDSAFQMHNHLQFNHALGNKKALFYHMQLYYKLLNKPIIKAFPTTFHIRATENDKHFKNFLEEYQRISRQHKNLRNIWILKPGQNSNRGCGITVMKDLKQIKKKIRLKDKHSNGQAKTLILQKYIERPLLYCNRKFDLRHYMIISAIHGRVRAYWYGQGYVRTSSYAFNLEQVNDPMIHLTNDAIQKNSEDYGSHEEGNKISYNQLQKYFSKQFPQKKFDINHIFSEMRELAKDAVSATFISLDPNRRLHNFEVFGLDFMIDDNLNVMLIEVNTNPCLELSSSLLSRIIPYMLDQSFRVSLDPIFPPPLHYTNNTKYLAPDCSLQKLQMEVIFDSEREGPELRRLYESHIQQYNEIMRILEGSEKQQDETFDNEGEEIQMENQLTAL